MSKDSIKRKIAALKAKTTKAGCTESEALAAAALAAKLMAEHGISEAEIEFTFAQTRATASIPRWHGWLHSAVCRATNTQSIRVSGIDTLVEFAGREHAVEIAMYLRVILVRVIDAEIRALRQTPQYRRLRKASSKADMVNSFALGMISRIDKKLQVLFADQINAADKAVAHQMLVKRHEGAEEVRGREVKTSNFYAYLTGAAAGDKVQLAHGVGGRNGAPLAIGGGS